MGTLVKVGNNIASTTIPARLVFTQDQDQKCTLTVVLRCTSRSQTTSDMGIDLIDSLITKQNLNATGVTALFDNVNPSILTITMTVDSKKPGTGPFTPPLAIKSKKAAAKKAAKKGAVKAAAKAPAKKKPAVKKKAAKSAKKK